MDSEKKYSIKIWNRKKPVPVSKEVYKAYYSMERRSRYLEERDRKNQVMLCGDLPVEIADSESTEGIVQLKEMISALYDCFKVLTDAEMEFVYFMFYMELSTKELAELFQLRESYILWRNQQIIEKLRFYMRQKGY